MIEIKNVCLNTVDMYMALVRAKYPMAKEIKDVKPITGIQEFMTNKDMPKLYKVAKTLASSPHGHGDDKFLRQIHISFDVIAPRYWWQEFDTYHFVVKNSQSTMHRIKSFDVVDMMEDEVDTEILKRFIQIRQEYIDNPTEGNFRRVKANLPEGFLLGAGITTNYGQLKTMYYQRKTHRLSEWREFCKFIESLPLSEFIVGTTKERK